MPHAATTATPFSMRQHLCTRQSFAFLLTLIAVLAVGTALVLPWFRISQWNAYRLHPRSVDAADYNNHGENEAGDDEQRFPRRPPPHSHGHHGHNNNDDSGNEDEDDDATVMLYGNGTADILFYWSGAIVAVRSAKGTKETVRDTIKWGDMLHDAPEKVYMLSMGIDLLAIMFLLLSATSIFLLLVIPHRMKKCVGALAGGTCTRWFTLLISLLSMIAVLVSWAILFAFPQALHVANFQDCTDREDGSGLRWCKTLWGRIKVDDQALGSEIIYSWHPGLGWYSQLLALVTAVVATFLVMHYAVSPPRRRGQHREMYSMTAIRGSGAGEGNIESGHEFGLFDDSPYSRVAPYPHRPRRGQEMKEFKIDTIVPLRTGGGSGGGRGGGGGPSSATRTHPSNHVVTLNPSIGGSHESAARRELFAPVPPTTSSAGLSRHSPAMSRPSLNVQHEGLGL